MHSYAEDLRCFITTANLDGETNLKVKEVPNGLPDFNPDKPDSLQGEIFYQKPNKNLYEFKGKIVINNQEL